ncbi:AAA family ATPase [Paenibacillus thalictri]|uniref:AAA family ATPase n=1 Tax=Paenibacillus thalictri TaxID=2527873 RepID=UPI0013EF1966|nr:ATP-binding protein [Paenibacillus thalictri]
MRTIKEVLEAEESRLFVGRQAELNELENWLAARDESWRLVYIHGLGGIGKSALLKMFMRRNSDRTFIHLDGSRNSLNPASLLTHIDCCLGGQENSGEGEKDEQERLADIINRLNRQAERKSPLILLMDTLEESASIEDWLRQRLLPSLSSSIRVVMAGRFPLGDAWGRSGWSSAIHSIHLQPLSRRAADEYMAARGCLDPGLRLRIKKIAGGIPLALSLACAAGGFAGGPQNVSDEWWLSDTIGILMKSVLTGMREEPYQTMLDAACMLWKFDQQTVERIVGRTLDDAHFHAFCRMPFVVKFGGGWRLDDTVRYWAEYDLRKRKPETYEAYRLRADSAWEDTSVWSGKALDCDPTGPPLEAAAESVGTVVLPLERLERLVKQLLQQYGRLEKSAELLSAAEPLLKRDGGEAAALKPEPVGMAGGIRLLFEQALRQLEEGGASENLYADIVRHAYIRRIGTHEAVAERLGLPTRSYYRSLHKAVEQFTLNVARTLKMET